MEEAVEVVFRHRMLGEYQEALGEARQLHRRARLAGDDALATLAGVELVHSLLTVGLFAEARRLATELHEDAPDDARVCLILAESLLAVGEVSAAREKSALARELVEADRERLSRRARALQDARCLQVEASIAQLQRRAAEGVGMATRALSLYEHHRAPILVQLQGIQTLAEALHRAGRHALAVDSWEEGLAFIDESLEAPQTHPERASFLHGRALSLRYCRRVKEAIADHRQALQIVEARLHDGHPFRAAILHGLAQALRRIGDFLGARDCLREALALSELSSGPDHTDTWITRFELGRLELDCGDPETGLARMSEARAVLEARLGKGHPTVEAMATWL